MPGSRMDSDSPDRSFFADDEVSPLILNLVRSAKKNVTLVTPYLRLWNHLENALDEAIATGVKVLLVIREDGERRLEDVEWLSKRKIQVRELPWLHAKIYLNESTIILSSMNITEKSATNSREVAFMVKEKDQDRIRLYVAALIKGSQPVRKEAALNEIKGNGACIRCAKSIDFNPERPLCKNCYQLWAEHSNPDYPERYCHSCGNVREVTFTKPLCRDCFRKHN